jgi:hypothetical protein
MKRITALLFALVVLSANLTATAQTNIQFYSTTAKNSVIPIVCEAEGAIIKPLLTMYHSPSWTWIVACSEADWNRVVVHIGQQDSAGGLTLATTDLENHVTYIRGFYVLHPFNLDDVSQPGHTIAHELGHILLHTRDEDRAEKKAGELLKEPQPTIIASK